MQDLINKIVKLLKGRVNQNNIEIQYNQDEIRRILNADRRLKGENSTLNDRNLINEELFRENDDFMHMQLQLREFSEKYGSLFSSKKESETELEADTSLAYFKKTVEGELSFEPGHPQFSNIQFFKQLLKYYEESENYEMCDQLVKMRTTENKF